jgi:hypothetical protein
VEEEAASVEEMVKEKKIKKRKKKVRLCERGAEAASRFISP